MDLAGRMKRLSVLLEGRGLEVEDVCAGKREGCIFGANPHLSLGLAPFERYLVADPDKVRGLLNAKAPVELLVRHYGNDRTFALIRQPILLFLMPERSAWERLSEDDFACLRLERFALCERAIELLL